MLLIYSNAGTRGGKRCCLSERAVCVCVCVCGELRRQKHVCALKTMFGDSVMRGCECVCDGRYFTVTLWV